MTKLISEENAAYVTSKREQNACLLKLSTSRANACADFLNWVSFLFAAALCHRPQHLERARCATDIDGSNRAQQLDFTRGEKACLQCNSKMFRSLPSSKVLLSKRATFNLFCTATHCSNSL